MLNLAGSWSLIDGVMVGSDTVDPLQYYYFPSSPHLAKDEQGRPAIRLMIYREDLEELPAGHDDMTGFLVLDTALDWPPEKLTKVGRKLQTQQQLPGAPRLVPVPFTAGTVQFYVLNKQSELPSTEGGGPVDGGGAVDGGGPAEPVRDEWVPSLLAAGMPALYSDNRAMLSAELSKKAAAVIDGSFNGFMPVGVVYQLTYVGMQPAFNVRVEANWEQVYKFMSERTDARFLWFSSDVEKVVDDLVDTKVITFKGTIEGVGDEGMEGQFNEVRKLLQGWVFDTFFDPVPNPDQVDPHAAENRVLDFLSDLRTVGSPIGVGYTRRELEMTEVRSLSVDYSVARAVERKIAPQGHLSVIFADAGITRDQVVTEIHGDDDRWRDLDFTITAAADFGPAALAKIDVSVWYGDSPDHVPPPNADIWTASLDAQHPVVQRSAWFKPEVGTSFLYRYVGIFSPQAVVGEGVTLDSGWRRGEGARLTVVPDELYTDRKVAFELSRLLPGELFPEVQVRLRYADPVTGWVYRDAGLLSADTKSVPFQFRTRQGGPAELGYQLSYSQRGDDPVETEWRTTEEPLVVVGDPRRNLFTVRVLVGGDLTRIRLLVLDLAYEDAGEQIFEEEKLQLDGAQLSLSHEWTFHRAVPERKRYSYFQTLIDIDGNVSTTGWVQDDRPTLIVGEVYARQWSVRPQLVGPALSEHNLAAVKLRLHYEDRTHALELDSEVVFTAIGPSEPWKLDLKDPGLRDYSYTVTYVTNTGVERTVGTRFASDTFLMISSVPPL